jgi:hypothetical protein
MNELEEYFRNLILQSLCEENIKPEVIIYLTQMMTSYAFRRLPDESLTIMMFGEPTIDRIVTLQEVGDSSLFISGFMRDWLGRKAIDKRYYYFLGSSAYDELAKRIKGALRPIYDDLSRKFSAYADALNDVKEMCDGMTGDAMAVVKEWIQTRSRRSETRLERMGMLLKQKKAKSVF